MNGLSLLQLARSVQSNRVSGIAQKLGVKWPPPPTVSVRNLVLRAKGLTLVGFADTHNHQFASLGFGGGGAIWGGDHGDISEALSWCTPAHGPGGLSDTVSNVLTIFGYPEPGIHNLTRGIGHRVGGYPQFDGWPRWDNISHQSVFEDWLQRAWEGGLRLMVMLAVNSEFMCGRVSKAPGRTCNDMEAVDYQLQAANDLQAYIDNKNGGPGKGWYRIVTHPQEARSVIAAGKLAIVLGIEVDNLFGSYLPSTLTEQQVQDQVNKYFAAGVRHVFLIHFADNAFGGTSFDKFLHYDPSKAGDLDTLEGIALPYPVKTEEASQQPFGYQYRGGRRNVQGLTELGKFAIREMMSRGMIIDIDHMSFNSRSDTLDIAESLNCPVVSGHTGFIEISIGNKKHEGQLLAGEIERIRKVGGMVSVIAHQGNLSDISTFDGGGTVVEHTCGNTSETLIQAYMYAVSKIQGGPVGLGTDFNGFAGLPGPRFGDEACPGGGQTQHAGQVAYPFVAAASGVQLDRSVVGQRKPFDINVDGLAHVGMLPDLIAEFQALGLTDADLSALLHSAGGYIQVWERALGKGRFF